MTELEQRIFDLALPICKKHQVELVEVNFFKDKINGHILEVIIDKEEGITLDDATIVNQELSDLLDIHDPIDTSYCLEVSSPGAERELKKEKDLLNSIGKYINVKTYEKIQVDKNQIKEIEGTLLSVSDDTLVLEVVIKTRKVEVSIERKLIAKVRLAIKF